MRIVEKSPTFGLIVGTRGFFNPVLAAEGREALLSRLTNLGYKYVIPPKDATPNGAIETLDDARITAEFFKDHEHEIDGFIVTLPNFGDEVAVVQTLDMADLDLPVLVHAFDDDLEKLKSEYRRDAFCGKLSVCNNLYQYGIPFTNTTYHSCSIESEIFEQDLASFAQVCRLIQGLTGARIGAIGARPAPFQTVRFSEKLLQETGITVVPVDLSEIIFRARALDSDDSAVEDKLARIEEYGAIPEYIPRQNVVKQAKLSVVIDRWMRENGCDASAIQCWDSIQKNYGCATCLTMSMMGERLLPSACEVDVLGAVSMYALLLASGNPPALLDWNNNYAQDRNKCVGIHCSNFPKSFIGKEDVEISNLDVLGGTLGPDRCFGAVKARVAAGPMTFFRTSTDDPRGIIKCYLGEGEFTGDPLDIAGGAAVCKVSNLQGLMDHLCKHGFEHHVAMARGHCSDVVEEAIGTYLDWDLYRHS
ncbi:MAG: fucose isomerase [Anaerolineae bacterium]